MTDSRGRTHAKARRELVVLATKTQHVHGWPMSLGRLHTGPKTWLWAFRCQEMPRNEQLEDGTRFEAVESFPTQGKA